MTPPHSQFSSYPVPLCTRLDGAGGATRLEGRLNFCSFFFLCLKYARPQKVK